MAEKNGSAETSSEQPPSAIALRPDRAIDRYAFEPSNWNEAQDVAKMIVESRLVPEGIKTWQQACVIIMRGRELGLTVMQAITSIYVIGGRTVMSADLIAARVMESGLAEYFDMIESTPRRCVFVTKRHGGRREVSMEWTLEMAQVARLNTRETWIKYPQALLRARCKADLARAVYPEVTTGLYDPDEFEGTTIDISPTSDIQPTIAERIKAAASAYNAFEASYGREHVDAAVGKARADLCTVEDWEQAVGKLRASVFEAAQRLAAEPASFSRGKEVLETRQPTVDDVGPPEDLEAENRQFYEEEGEAQEADPFPSPSEDADDPEPPPPPVQPAQPLGIPVDDRMLLAALRASTLPPNTQLAAVSREKFSKNPDKLDPTERRQLLAYLGGKAKVQK